MSTLRELTEYHKPSTIDEAIKLLRRRKVRTVPIAGGGDLLPSAPRDVQAVVALSGLGLSYVRVSAAGGFEIGATTTLQTILEDARLRDYADGTLIKAIADTASRNVRAAATIAGSLVSAAGNSPLFTVLLALDAQLIRRGLREQTIALADWTHQAGTLILQVTLPALANGVRCTYEKVARTPTDLPIVCVAACATKASDAFRNTRLALGGVADRPVLLALGETNPEQAVESARASIEPASDYFASAAYRREMIGVLVRRALA
jgi:probable selenate reductase FAD-binding subunit